MENWKNANLRQAAAVVNAEEGVSYIMAIIISYISDAYLCRFKVIAYTTVLCIILEESLLGYFLHKNISIFPLGLLLLGVSTWLTPDLEVRLFYPIVLLIAVGKAGRGPPLKAFLADQLTDDSKQNQAIVEEQVEARKIFWWRVAWSLGVVASFGLSTGSWRWTFLTSSIVMGVAYLWFLSGIKFFHCKKPTGSPLTNVYKVFKAAVLKRHLDYPNTGNGYFKNDSHQLILWPNVPFFRWLDMASIMEEQEIAGRLCTITQVKQVKCILIIVPIWTTFDVCGMLEATRRTFFIEQANNLDDNIGSHFIVPVPLFITLKSLVRFVVSFLLQLLIPKSLSRSNRHRLILVRIGLGMVFSIFSCIAAWQVEVHRLNLIKKETMSIFWLAPKFTLLGLMAGFAEDGLRHLFHNHVAEPKKLYESSIMDCTLGIGNFLSILVAFIFRAWFGDNIKSSRLDNKYFLMLARLTIGNLCLYCLMTLVLYKFWCEEEAQQENLKLNLDGSLEDADLTDLVTDNSL
ncbi:hypothetical protein REPUB_Repub02eG0276800 [Reevesia pubescens]